MRSVRWLFFCCGVLIGVFFCVVVSNLIIPGIQINLTEKRERGKQYTSPLLECDAGEPLPIEELTAIKKSIEAIRRKHEKKVQTSVYIRDLLNGGRIMFNDADSYFSASLMKVPVLIALYKEAEAHPNILNKKLAAYEGEVVHQNIVSEKLTQPGEKLTIQELMRRSVANSDNRANNTLVQYLGIERINKVLRDFGLAEAKLSEPYLTTPEYYGIFFRVLYNATYLSPENSENLLRLLTKTEFEKGLRSGIPASVPNAHKFGEQVIDNNGNKEYQLHDCGIVYTRRPYVVCVMSKGNSFDDLFSLMHEVSVAAYNIMSK